MNLELNKHWLTLSSKVIVCRLPMTTWTEGRRSRITTTTPSFPSSELQEELPTEQPVRQTINVKPLNEKAVLVTLKRGMYRPYISDVNATEEYGAGTVNKHLFDGRDNLVKRAVAKFTAVYTYVNDNTVPWAVGQRMLNMMNWTDFTSDLRGLVDDAYAAVDTLCDNWDSVWRNDLARIHQIGMAKVILILPKRVTIPTSTICAAGSTSTYSICRYQR